MTAQPTILWDFDGTLAVRPGFWSGALLTVLDERVPGHNVKREQIRDLLRSAFPWDAPDVPHPHLCAPGAWWAAMETAFVRVYRGLGLDEAAAGVLAAQAHERYLRADGFIVYDDVIPVLRDFYDRGWRNVILSNHVPELPDIVRALALAPYVSTCVTSAVIGYEKPHKEAFRIALALSGNPDVIWMVGDNPVADVAGAEGVGIPAVLVRTPPPDGIRYHAPGLREAAAIITAQGADCPED